LQAPTLRVLSNIDVISKSINAKGYLLERLKTGDRKPEKMTSVIVKNQRLIILIQSLKSIQSQSLTVMGNWNKRRLFVIP